MTCDTANECSIVFARIVGGHLIDTSDWATPDEGAMSASVRARYFARKLAVSLYASGAKESEIRQRTSLGTKQCYRLIRERCLVTHSDGRPYGWRGLVPQVRIRPYKRQSSIRVDQFGCGAVGAMESMLDCHPDLRAALNARIVALVSSKKLGAAKRTKIRHFRWFIEQLRGLGYEARQEWPFNTESRGYYSVCRYVNKIMAANPRALADSVGGPDLVRKLKTGDGTSRPVSKFMQRVEMDAHKLDGRFCVSIPQVGGGFQEKIVHRLWVIVVIEVVSRAVIGYYLSMGREVSMVDVLRVLKRSLGRWVPRKVSFCDTPYMAGAGLLSSLGDEFVGLCWSETCVDGALAETSEHVRNALQDAVHSVLLDPKTSYAKRHSKDDRPFIEAYFRNLAGRGFQRLSNTTGAKPQDKQGRNPEAVALTSRFQYEYAEELLDVLIANYNATPHSGIGNRTPLEYAKFLHKNSVGDFRYADPDLVEKLLSFRKLCMVRGGAQTGRAPFVDFYYAKYTNSLLQSRQDLVGAKIWVIWNKEDDGRFALASTVDGTSLGIVRAAPPWNISPHNLMIRKTIAQLAKLGKLSLEASSDAIEVFLQFVETQSHRKLPVHPAYLEARRILVEATEQSIGASMLEVAKTRARESSIECKTQPKSAPADFSNDFKAQALTDKEKTSNLKSPLPPRRMAATR